MPTSPDVDVVSTGETCLWEAAILPMVSLIRFSDQERWARTQAFTPGGFDQGRVGGLRLFFFLIVDASLQPRSLACNTLSINVNPAQGCGLTSCTIGNSFAEPVKYSC